MNAILKQKGFPNSLRISSKKHDVVIVGESHHGEHDEVIVRFLDEFGKYLCKVLIELPVDFQSSVQTYVERGVVDANLESLFAGAEREGKNIRGMLDVFRTVHEIGKEVLCIDSSKTQEGEYQTRSKHGKYFLRGGSRDEDMFVNFQREYERTPGKYLLIVGGNHAQEGKHPLHHDDTLAERLKNHFGDRYASIEMRAGEY